MIAPNHQREKVTRGVGGDFSYKNTESVGVYEATWAGGPASLRRQLARRRREQHSAARCHQASASSTWRPDSRGSKHMIYGNGSPWPRWCYWSWSGRCIIGACFSNRKGERAGVSRLRYRATERAGYSHQPADAGRSPGRFVALNLNRGLFKFHRRNERCYASFRRINIVSAFHSEPLRRPARRSHGGDGVVDGSRGAGRPAYSSGRVRRARL